MSIHARNLISKREIADKSKIPEPTLEKIFSGQTKNPGVNTIQALVHALGKTLDDLEGKSGPIKSAPSGLPEEALKVAHRYNGLDGYGKTMVQVVVTQEEKRVEAENAKKREKSIWEDAGDGFGGQSTARVIPLYFTPAAAGYISPTFGDDFDYIEVGGEVPAQADFAINIEGDSMEPYIMDGATVYVNRDPIAEGDVGIFFLDGDMLCKQYHRDEDGNVHLLSLNRERADADRFVSADSGASLTCFGRVMLPNAHRPAL